MSMYINGQWITAEGNRTYPIQNPATGEEIAIVADGGRHEVQLAIAAAQQAFPQWAAMPAKERGILLKRAEAIIIEKTDEIASLITKENGKAFKEAQNEVRFAAGYLSWFAEEGRRVYGEIIPSPFRHKRIATTYKPLGVIGAITPWNFPANMITRKIAPALAAGCTVVLKPAENTPLTALAIAQAFHDAGFPKGIFNIVTANDPKSISHELIDNPAVKMLTFTGSVSVGKILMAQAAQGLKKVALELGGNAPAIVFDDADLDKAVERIAAMKFLRVSGQSCICVNRIYVHTSLYQKFVESFVRKVKTLKIGNGLAEGTQIGPLISAKALEGVHKLVEEAKRQGAKVLLGGNILSEGEYSKGFFYAPTVLEGSRDEWPICQKEIFGPVANILSFSEEKEVIERANSSTYGLAAYVFSRNINTVLRVTEALEYGYVAINDGEGYTHELPIGGFKESGIGREGGQEGLLEYMDIKSVLVNLD